MESCPAVEPSPHLAATEYVSFLRRKFPFLGGFDDLVVAGSVVHGTAITGNSGLDVMCVDRAGGWKGLTGREAVSLVQTRWFRTGLVSRLGVSAATSEVGTVTFVPAKAECRTSELLIADPVRDTWKPSSPRRHSEKVRALSDLERCAIRVVKTWASSRTWSGLGSFRLEAMAIEASGNYVPTPPHIHWRLKHLMQSVLDSVKDSKPHPLDAAVRFDELEVEDRPKAAAEIEVALGAANDAWFLLEFQPVQDARDAVAWIARLVDPSLGASG
jgi:hypothetical protein